VLISTRQYWDDILTVLVSEQILAEDRKKLLQHPAISSCVEKQGNVYRITTTTAPKKVLSSFPLREAEEWYLGPEKVAYLCVQSYLLSEEQITWLATSEDIAVCEYLFDLTPMPARP